MSQHYSDPDREHEPYALPDVETFYMSESDFIDADVDSWIYDLMLDRNTNPADAKGWYYWYCFPGCLPESDPRGPYDTEQEALDACREDCE